MKERENPRKKPVRNQMYCSSTMVGPIPMGEDFKVGNQIPNFFLFQLQTQFRTAGDDVDKKRRVLNPEGLPRQTLL